MPAHKRLNAFGDIFRSRVTYHRDVAKERRELKRQAFADRKERLQIRKLEAQERAAAAKIATADRKIAAAESKIAKASTKGGRGGTSEAAFEAMKARMEREIQAQEEHKRAALAKIGNPTWGYGIYQGKGFATRQLAHFRSKAAAETYARSAGLKGYSIKRAFDKTTGGTGAGNPRGQHDRGSSPNPSYTLQLYDELSKRGSKYNFHSGNLELAQRRAQEYADDMGFDAVLYESDGQMIARFTTSRPHSWRRNPETAEGDGSEEYEQAKRTAELFHGRPVKEQIEVEEKIRTHDWYVSIGPLIKLIIKPVTKKPKARVPLPFHQSEAGQVQLFCSPDGKQFYLRGGDQELDLNAFGMGEKSDWFRDHMLIGEAVEVTYRDRKKFHSFKLTDYYHKLGEQTRVKPTLVYDSLSKKLSIIGGQYRIEMEDLVDGMSPGIVN
jgi:hypothetical protein